MTKRAVWAFAALSIFVARAAQADDSTFTRGEAVTAGALSAGLSLSEIVLLKVPHMRGVRYALELSSAAPAIVVDPTDGAEFAATQATFVGTSYGTSQASRHHDAVVPYFHAVDSLAFESAFFGAYLAYRDARAHGSSPAWNDKWRPWTADELIVAPFRARFLKQPIVWVPTSLLVGIFGSAAGVSVARGTVPRTAARDALLGLPVGLDAGVAEESLFRAFFYEELQLSLGRGPARMIDLTVFTAGHIPAQMLGQSAGTIVVSASTKVIGGIIFETAYDEGGLPESVAAHALWDMTLGFLEPFVKGLAPKPQRASAKTAGLTFSAPLISGGF